MLGQFKSKKSKAKFVLGMQKTYSSNISADKTSERQWWKNTWLWHMHMYV